MTARDRVVDRTFVRRGRPEAARSFSRWRCRLRQVYQRGSQPPTGPNDRASGPDGWDARAVRRTDVGPMARRDDDGPRRRRRGPHECTDVPAVTAGGRASAADLEDLAAALRAGALKSRLAVLHRDLLRVLDLDLHLVLDAVRLGHRIKPSS